MSKSWGRAAAIVLLAMTVLVAVLMAAAWSMLPLDETALTLHGETISLADLHGWDAALFFMLAVAIVVIALVAALCAVIVGLGFGALGIGIGLLATAGSLAMVVAPFALVVWLVWRLLRPTPAPVIVAAP